MALALAAPPDIGTTRRVAVLAALLALGLAYLGWLLWPAVAARLIYAPRAERLVAALHVDPRVLDGVRAQNALWAHKTPAWAIEQDRVWGEEKRAGGGPFLDAMLARPASQRLRELIAATGGVARHVILMDASGRIAAVPLPAFNFWQFPKPKFQKTYPLGPGARHVNVLEWGHDRSFAACWLSETLVDPETRTPIGAFGIELDYAYVGDALCRPTP
jgi:hypothetical protein